MFKILIVEDDNSLRELLVERFASGSHGFTVTQAPSGNAAIRLLESGERFSVIVSDFNMPDGNGADLQRYLVQTNSRSLFFFFTSEKDCPTDPAHRYYVATIQKPHIKELTDEVLMGICTAPFRFQKSSRNSAHKDIVTPLSGMKPIFS